jgi:hypothetical protein
VHVILASGDAVLWQQNVLLHVRFHFSSLSLFPVNVISFLIAPAPHRTSTSSSPAAGAT